MANIFFIFPSSSCWILRFTVRKKILKSYGNICYYILNRNFSRWLTICILDSHFGMTVCTITNLINDNNSNNIQLMVGIILSLKTRSDCAVSELENLPDELKDSMPNCHLQITYHLGMTGVVYGIQLPCHPGLDIWITM